MAKKRVAKKAGAAKKRTVNKSMAIRDYKTANPDAGPTAVSDALAKEQRIKVTPAFVSTVLSSSKKKKKKGKRPGRPRGVKAAKAAKPASFTVAELVQAKKLADEVGGIDKAKAVIDALSKVS